jgi:hypothetical protein
MIHMVQELFGQTLRELAPCPLCGPPNEPAVADNEYAQRNPSINPCGNDPNAQHDHRCDHRKIIRAGVATVRAIATSRIQNACSTHPDEGDNPDQGANRYRSKQAGKNGCFRHPPRKQTGVNTAKPIARGLSLRVGHRLLRAAGGRTRFTGSYCLNWRTRYRAVGAEHAAIASLRLQFRAAAGAFIEELTGIGRHGLRFCNGAVRTNYGRLKKHRINSWVRTDSRPWWLPMSVGSHRLWRRHR